MKTLLINDDNKVWFSHKTFHSVGGAQKKKKKEFES